MSEVRSPFRIIAGSGAPVHRASPRFPHPEHPLVLCVRDAQAVDQADFAVRAAAIIGCVHPDLVPEARPGGLRLLARHELALNAAVAELRFRFGDRRLHLDGPKVRSMPGLPERRPVMTVLVRVPRRYVTGLRLDLIGRGARAVAVESGLFASILRAEVPQSELLGYPAWLDEHSGGLAELAIRLERYEAVPANDGEPRC